MKNLLALVGLLVVGFGGVGWYMGWYTLKVNRNDTGGLSVQTDVNTKKVAEDSGNWLHQAGQFLDAKVKKAADDAKVPTPGPVGTTPGPVTAPTPPQANQPAWLLPPTTYPVAPTKP